MFTGIVEALGEVSGIEQLSDSARLTISWPGAAPPADIQLGDSVAVNGVCLTVTVIDGGSLTADLMMETLKRSALGGLAPGDQVNLERAVRADGRLDGHIVQGHVDDVATIVSRAPSEHWDQLRISLPAGLARYVAEKGSIAVDGVSLTVSGLGQDWFEVSLIPETLSRTTLGFRRPGDAVNLEADVIAKYVERLVAR